ncbi:hypothetical protein, partial [Acinetobacter rathckeae]|uniref:hypothetical protein n=1 Tax=Acinetobacter rathckeae TaxID=2605272 RepID=UPI0018A31B14
ILVLFNSYVSERIIGRFSNTSVNDGSTFARIESFNIGNYLFWKEPFLGYGYNFSINLQKQLRGGGIALDSSLQTILVSFGFIGSTFLGLIIVAFIYSLYQKYKKQDNQQRKMIYSCYILYLIVSILFMSIFNQLMLYPFWLIPIVSFGIYLLIRK